jgi:Papain family cysteine protease
MPDSKADENVSVVNGRILNCIPSTGLETDWSSRTALESGVLAATPPPPSIDLRGVWWSVADQEQTGSCVGWACADSVIRWHMVKAQRLDQNEMLSVRQIWVSAKETDEFVDAPSSFIEQAGTSLKSALDIARNYGVVTADTLPFDLAIPFMGQQNTFYALASQRKISAYFNLEAKLTTWRRWLAENGPILTRLDCDDAWFACSSANPQLTNYVKPNKPAGHAVALVGYTADHFIVRNSWGTQNWGDGGYAYASNAYALAAFTESYGVTV